MECVPRRSVHAVGLARSACATPSPAVTEGSIDRGVQVVGAAGRHEQRQDHAQQGHAGQDVEDGVEREAGGDQEAAEQRAADAAEPAEPGAPRHRRTADLRGEVVGHEAEDQRLGAAGAQADDRDEQQEDAEREADGEQRDGDRADQEAARDHRLGTEPVREPGADQRAEHRAAVEHQQERERALGREPGAASSARAARC